MFSFFFSSLLIDRHEKNIWIAGALLCVCTGRCCLLIADDAATDLSTSRPPRASTLSYWLHISSSLIYQFSSSSSSSSSSKRTKKNGRTIRRKIKKTCLFFFFFKVHSSSSSGSNWWETRKGIWYKSLCPCSSTFGSQTNKHTHTTDEEEEEEEDQERRERERPGGQIIYSMHLHYKTTFWRDEKVISYRLLAIGITAAAAASGRDDDATRTVGGWLLLLLLTWWN